MWVGEWRGVESRREKVLMTSVRIEWGGKVVVLYVES